MRSQEEYVIDFIEGSVPEVVEPRVAADAADNFVVTWSQRFEDFDIWARRWVRPSDSEDPVTGESFRVHAETAGDWRDVNGAVGRGRVVPVSSEDSGLFWFFSSDNWEMMVKVLDGCELNSFFWVFAAATTDVEYTLTVIDTQTDERREYTNPLGVASPAITDTRAFATCSASGFP